MDVREKLEKHMPQVGPNPQSCVLPGIEPVTFCSAGQHPIN